MAPLIVEDTFLVEQADFISYFVIDRKSKVKVNSIFCDIFPLGNGCMPWNTSFFIFIVDIDIFLIFYRGTNMEIIEIQLQLVYVNQNNNVLLKMAKNSLIDRKTDNTMSRKNMTKGLTTINKALHNKILIISLWSND